MKSQMWDIKSQLQATVTIMRKMVNSENFSVAWESRNDLKLQSQYITSELWEIKSEVWALKLKLWEKVLQLWGINCKFVKYIVTVSVECKHVTVDVALRRLHLETKIS